MEGRQYGWLKVRGLLLFHLHQVILGLITCHLPPATPLLSTLQRVEQDVRGGEGEGGGGRVLSIRNNVTSSLVNISCQSDREEQLFIDRKYYNLFVKFYHQFQFHSKFTFELSIILFIRTL